VNGEENDPDRSVIRGRRAPSVGGYRYDAYPLLMRRAQAAPATARSLRYVSNWVMSAKSPVKAVPYGRLPENFWVSRQ